MDRLEKGRLVQRFQVGSTDPSEFRCFKLTQMFQINLDVSDVPELLVVVVITSFSQRIFQFSPFKH